MVQKSASLLCWNLLAINKGRLGSFSIAEHDFEETLWIKRDPGMVRLDADRTKNHIWNGVTSLTADVQLTSSTTVIDQP